MTDVIMDTPGGSLSAAQKMDAAVSDATDSFQAVIDHAADQTTDLRAQRDALIAQITPLQEQIAALNAQINAAEGPEVKKARQIQRAIDRINKGQRLGDM